MREGCTIHFAAYAGNASGAAAACRAGWFRRPHQLPSESTVAHAVSGCPDDVTCADCRATDQYRASERAWARINGAPSPQAAESTTKDERSDR
jgi:hypothetical protein